MALLALLALSRMKVQKVQKVQSKNLTVIMARFTTEAGIDDLTGKFSKHSRLVMRQKEWHSADDRKRRYLLT